MTGVVTGATPAMTPRRKMKKTGRSKYSSTHCSSFSFQEVRGTTSHASPNGLCIHDCSTQRNIGGSGGMIQSIEHKMKKTMKLHRLKKGRRVSIRVSTRKPTGMSGVSGEKPVSLTPELSPEQRAYITRQEAGLPRCGRCQTCRDDFFFEQICDEVEGTYQDKTVQ